MWPTADLYISGGMRRRQGSWIKKPSDREQIAVLVSRMFLPFMAHSIWEWSQIHDCAGWRFKSTIPVTEILGNKETEIHSIYYELKLRHISWLVRSNILFMDEYITLHTKTFARFVSEVTVRVTDFI